MAWPAKGPGCEPFVVDTVATTAASGSLTPVICVAKYSEKRVSRKIRSPIESAGGVTSASGVGSGASPLNRNRRWRRGARRRQARRGLDSAIYWGTLHWGTL